jgi:hypothetical protein
VGSGDGIAISAAGFAVRCALRLLGRHPAVPRFPIDFRSII